MPAPRMRKPISQRKQRTPRSSIALVKTGMASCAAVPADDGASAGPVSFAAGSPNTSVSMLMTAKNSAIQQEVSGTNFAAGGQKRENHIATRMVAMRMRLNHASRPKRKDATRRSRNAAAVPARCVFIGGSTTQSAQIKTTTTTGRSVQAAP